MHKTVFILSLVFGFCQQSTAHACGLPTSPKPEYTYNLAHTADQILLAEVSHVTRRRWSEDDTLPAYVKELRERAESGEELTPGEVHTMAYSEAVAWMNVDLDMTYLSQLENDPPPKRLIRQIPIDLKRGADVGSNSCEQIPNTCPIDIQPGKFLILALQSTSYGPYLSIVCLPAYKIPQARDLLVHIVKALQHVDLGEVLFVHHLEGLRIKTANEYDQQMASRGRDTRNNPFRNDKYIPFWVAYSHSAKLLQTQGRLEDGSYAEIFQALRRRYDY